MDLRFFATGGPNCVYAGTSDTGCRPGATTIIAKVGLWEGVFSWPIFAKRFTKNGLFELSCEKT